MAEELRLALILLGSLAIGAVVLHGIWTVRKNVNEERKLQSKEQPQDDLETQEESIDPELLKIKQMEMDFSVFETTTPDKPSMPVVDMNVDSIYHQEQQTHLEEHTHQDALFGHDANELPMTEESLSFSAVDEQDGDEMPMVEIDSADDVIAVEEGLNDQVHSQQESRLTAKPAINSLSEIETQKTESKPQPKTEPEKDSEVLILYVDKPDGEMIDGARLLPILLTLGFKFGEMDFFHRHEQSSGHGEILFSLANMYNPGTFDIDNMEQVSTRGLSIFMTLPNAGDALQTFNMMHNAAKKIADEFGANVLDSNRQKLDVLRVRHYVEKIRKF